MIWVLPYALTPFCIFEQAHRFDLNKCFLFECYLDCVIRNCYTIKLNIFSKNSTIYLEFFQPLYFYIASCFHEISYLYFNMLYAGGTR
jgi:hypothetical protein